MKTILIEAWKEIPVYSWVLKANALTEKIEKNRKEIEEVENRIKLVDRFLESSHQKDVALVKKKIKDLTKIFSLSQGTLNLCKNHEWIVEKYLQPYLNSQERSLNINN